MKKRLSYFALIFITIVSCGLAYGQNSWDSYKPRTLAEIIKLNSDPETLKKVDVIIPGDLFPSQVKVTYTGASRKISAARKDFINIWEKSHALTPELKGLFDDELLFIEGSVEHWLPVQKQVIPYFEKELQKGEQVTLFTVWAGAKKIEGKWNWIFFVNEFEK
jgi:hypothetical protein